MDKFLLNYNEHKQITKDLSDRFLGMSYHIIILPVSADIFGFVRAIYLNKWYDNITKYYLNDAVNSDKIYLYRDLQNDFDKTINKLLKYYSKNGANDDIIKQNKEKINEIILNRYEYIKMLKRFNFSNLPEDEFIKHILDGYKYERKLIYYDHPNAINKDNIDYSKYKGFEFLNLDQSDYIRYIKYILKIKKVGKCDCVIPRNINILDNEYMGYYIDQIFTINNVYIINKYSVFEKRHFLEEEYKHEYTKIIKNIPFKNDIFIYDSDCDSEYWIQDGDDIIMMNKNK